MVEEKNEKVVEENVQDKEETSGKNQETEGVKEKNERSSLENLRVLENIDVKLTVEVGGAEIKLRDLLRINEGSVIELERLAGEPLDILANGTKIAKGEVVTVGDQLGLTVVEIVSPMERVKPV